MKEDMILIKKPSVTLRPVDEDGILYDEETGELHLLNHSSLFIWEQLDQGVTLRDIAGSLAKRYEIDNKRALSDVCALADELQERKLVQLKDA